MLRTRGLASLLRYFTVRYTEEHEWVHFDEKSRTGTMGISEYAQCELGDIVHVHLSKLDSRFKKGEVLGTIESDKVVENIYMPMSGTIIEINSLVVEHPEVINQSAEANGWIAKLKAEDEKELEGMMDSDAYNKYVEGIISKL
jgi:glycine cleavage system H protein